MGGSERTLYGLVLVCLDVMVLLLSLVTGFEVRFRNIPLANWDSALMVLPYTALSMAVVFHLLNLYQSTKRVPVSDIITGTVVGNTFVFVISGALCYWIRAFAAPRSILVIWFSINIVYQLVTRLIVWRVSWAQPGQQQILVVAETEVEARRVESQIRLDRQHSSALIREVSLPYPWSWEESLKPVTTIVVGASVDKRVFREIHETALRQGKHVHLVPDSTDLLTMTTTVDTLGDILTFSYRPLQIARPYSFVKRVLDLAGSFVLLSVFSIPTLLLFAMIPLTSHGASLYKQRRVGLEGKEFDVYKFRSMVVNAERDTGPVLAQYRDPRVTRLGRLMRATRLDELPQLFNVVKGDMSLVGPRPERPEFVQQFQALIPGYAQRHRVRPGITGFAQVSTNYATEAEDKLRYDLWYIRHYHPLLDLKILFQTVLVVLRPSKARGVQQQQSTSEGSTVRV